MKRKSVILTVTGASGVGKTTIVRELLAKDPALRVISSTTTRSPRPTDIPGEYRYVPENEFHALEVAGDFLWTVSVHGFRYGTRKSDIDEALGRDEDIFLIILIPERVATLKSYAPRGQVVPLYIAGPAPNILAQRLRDRGDDEETIARRVSDCVAWEKEMKQSAGWFFRVENSGPLHEAIGVIQDFIRTIRLGGC